MRYGNTPMERRQEAEASCAESEAHSLALDATYFDNAARDKLDRQGQECIEAIQQGLGGECIAEYERERRERREAGLDLAD